MNFKVNESATKLRGGYYTPFNVAAFLSHWILYKKPKNILEPSCGDGVFLSAVGDHLAGSVKFIGVELIPQEANKSRQRAKQTKGIDASIHCAEFLSWILPRILEEPCFDAVVGNPPYIRYQYLDAKTQIVAEQIFDRLGLPFTRHTNAWVSFIVASLAVLRPGGRLAMVIPAEILHVLHAAPLRSYLQAQCSRVLLIDPNELLFEEALQGTVLILAEKIEGAVNKPCGVAIHHAADNSFLKRDPEQLFRSSTYNSGAVLEGKWMKLLLSERELGIYENSNQRDSVSFFSDLAKVDVGIVTGANSFFLVDDETVDAYGLRDWVQPMFGRSVHCEGVVYNSAQHKRNSRNGLPTNFVMFGDTPVNKLSKKARDYIKLGELQQLPKRYKCSLRTPWYNVPSVYTSNVAMLKRSHHFPRMILNKTRALTTDTAYRIQPHGVNAEKLVYCFTNSLTALSAEIEGRHYGGGVLELVPSEIEKLLIPFPKALTHDISALDEKVRMSTSADSLLYDQDGIILRAAGFSHSDRMVIHQAWARIRNRRLRLQNDPSESSEPASNE